MPSMRTCFLSAVTVLMVAAITTGLAAGEGFLGKGDDDRDDGHGAYVIGLWGDLPYSDVQVLTGVANLIADMNEQDLAFTVHDGDLKAGNSIANSVTPSTSSSACRARSGSVGCARKCRRSLCASV